MFVEELGWLRSFCPISPTKPSQVRRRCRSSAPWNSPERRPSAALRRGGRAAARTPPQKVRKFAWELEGTEVELLVGPAPTDVAGPGIPVLPMNAFGLLHVEQSA